MAKNKIVRDDGFVVDTIKLDKSGSGQQITKTSGTDASGKQTTQIRVVDEPIAPVVAEYDPNKPISDTNIRPEKEPASISDVVAKTYEEQAKDQFKGQFLTNQQQAKEMGIELPYKTYDEFLAYQKAGQRADTDYLTEQQGYARALEGAQMEQAFEQMDASEAGITASLAQGREGVTSTSQPRFIAEYGEQLNRQKRQLEVERQAAESRRQKALSDLKRAQQKGDASLAEAIQGQLSTIENNIRRIDTEALNAATAAQEQALNVESSTRQNLTTFTNLINEGTELSVQGITSFAKQLNIPFESAYDYYQGAEQIRNDKSLSVEEKRIANEQNQFNLENAISGGVLQAENKQRYFRDAVARGEDPTELAIMLDLPNEFNPVYQLKVRREAAETKIREIEASGKPIPGSLEDLELRKAKLELEQAEYEQNQLYGDFDLQPGDVSINDIDVTKPGSNSILSYDRIYKGSSANKDGVDFAAEIGTPVKSNISGRVVSVYNDAVPGDFEANGGWGNQVIIEAGGRQYLFNHLNNVNVVAGDFINAGTLLGGVGNTGKVLTEDEEVPTPEQIAAGRGSHLDYTVKENGQKVSLDTAFKYANGEQVSTQIDLSSVPFSDISEVNRLSRSVTTKLTPQQKALETKISEAFNDPDTKLTELTRLSAGGKDFTDTSREQFIALENAQNNLNMIMSISDDDAGTLVGAFGRKIKSLVPGNIKPKEMEAALTAATPGLARGVFGEVGVLTDADIERYQSLLPKLTDTKAQKAALQELLLTSLENAWRSQLSNAAKSKIDVSRYGTDAQRIENLKSELNVDGLANLEDDLNTYNESPEEELEFENEALEYIQAQQNNTN
jgi:murein DD-endopeptidase MepM/ murein hydrolase activator NlpD